MNKLSILTTGGTIEKTYNEFEGTLLNRTSQVRSKLLKRLRLPYQEILVRDLMSKDSLDMTLYDRDFISKNIDKDLTLGRSVVVLHGTDSLEHTAKYCFDNILNPERPVIFTGAMKPTGFENSDALQNFTEAIYASSILSPGFYVSFHGRLFEVPNLRKNLVKGTFETYAL